MSARWASASGLERIFQCPASAVLPHSQDTSIAAKSGQDDHAALEVACGHEPPEFIRMPKGESVSSVELRVPRNSLSEQAYGYDVVADVVFGWGRLESERAYPETPYSVVTGTADVVGVDELDGKRVVRIVDWKTGSSEHLSDSMQLRTLAFMAARFHGAEIAQTRITYVRGGVVSHVPSRTWSAAELAATGVLLRKKYDEVNKLGWKKDEIGLGHVKRGPGCHFCPSVVSCPYFQQLFKGQLGQLQTGDMREFYFNKEALRTALDRMTDGLKIAASSGPIDLGEGLWYGKKNGKFIKFREERHGVHEEAGTPQ